MHLRARAPRAQEGAQATCVCGGALRGALVALRAGGWAARAALRVGRTEELDAPRRQHHAARVLHVQPVGPLPGDDRRGPDASPPLAPVVVAALRARQPRLAVVARVESVELPHQDAGLAQAVGRAAARVASVEGGHVRLGGGIDGGGRGLCRRHPQRQRRQRRRRVRRRRRRWGRRVAPRMVHGRSRWWQRQRRRRWRWWRGVEHEPRTLVAGRWRRSDGNGLGSSRGPR